MNSRRGDHPEDVVETGNAVVHSGGHDRDADVVRHLPVIAEVHPMAIRYSLGCLLAFGALNALGGGYYGLTGAVGVPTQWLEGSRFEDYFVPSLILLVVVGGSFIVAAIAVFARLRADRFATVMAAVVVLGWLTVQIAIIGYVSWMQPATAIAGVLVLILGSQLPRHEPIAQ